MWRIIQAGSAAAATTPSRHRPSIRARIVGISAAFLPFPCDSDIDISASREANRNGVSAAGR
jgi:hypothetical protein